MISQNIKEIKFQIGRNMNCNFFIVINDKMNDDNKEFEYIGETLQKLYFKKDMKGFIITDKLNKYEYFIEFFKNDI